MSFRPGVAATISSRLGSRPFSSNELLSGISTRIKGIVSDPTACTGIGGAVLASMKGTVFQRFSFGTLPSGTLGDIPNFSTYYDLGEADYKRLFHLVQLEAVTSNFNGYVFVSNCLGNWNPPEVPGFPWSFTPVNPYLGQQVSMWKFPLIGQTYISSPLALSLDNRLEGVRVGTTVALSTSYPDMTPPTDADTTCFLSGHFEIV